jgi:hypothetical protein
MPEPLILLGETNPFGTMEALVEDDGRTVYLYLRHSQLEDRPMHAVWVANRLPAPELDDVLSMRQGVAPLMARAGTRHPEGYRGLAEGDLSLVWFQEGDGVALLEGPRVMAVLPPWSGQEGFPGYAAEAVGEQVPAWSLDERSLEGLAPRIEESRRHWEGWSKPDRWQRLQDAVLGHLAAKTGGMQAGYWAADGGKFPPLGVTRFDRAGGPSVVSTVGMSGHRMPQVEMHDLDPRTRGRVELAVAVPADDRGDWPVRLAARFGRYPWFAYEFFAAGHTADVPKELRGTIKAERGRFTDRPPAGAPDLSGLTEPASGDPVTVLWLEPS